jgi:hypothetical protein
LYTRAASTKALTQHLQHLQQLLLHNLQQTQLQQQTHGLRLAAAAAVLQGVLHQRLQGLRS